MSLLLHPPNHLLITPHLLRVPGAIRKPLQPRLFILYEPLPLARHIAAIFFLVWRCEIRETTSKRVHAFGRFRRVVVGGVEEGCIRW